MGIVHTGRTERARSQACGPIVVAAAVWLATASPTAAHAPTELAKQQMLNGGLADVAWIGAEHMLTGYDHLLFLLGVMFYLTRPRDILSFVTAFTAGHTLVLLTATSAGVGANPYVVDALIALTVVYKGFENLDGFPRLLRVKAPPQLPMVFGFGLVHGLGLSTRLQEMTLAQDPRLTAKILSFNVGVELGQVVALAFMGAVLWLWRGTDVWPRVSRLTNAGLILAGLWLFAGQVQALLSDPPKSAQTSNPSRHL